MNLFEVKNMENQSIDKEDTHRNAGYRFVLTRSGVYRKIGISEGDHKILTIYAHQYRIPKTTLLHEMIGCAAKCWEEKHNQTTKELEEHNKTKARIVIAYLKKYGPIKKGSMVDELTTLTAQEESKQPKLKEKEGNV